MTFSQAPHFDQPVSPRKSSIYWAHRPQSTIGTELVKGNKKTALSATLRGKKMSLEEKRAVSAGAISAWETGPQPTLSLPPV